MTPRPTPRHARARRAASVRRAPGRRWAVLGAVGGSSAVALAVGGWAGGTGAATQVDHRAPGPAPTTVPTTTTTTLPSAAALLAAVPVAPVPGGAAAVGDSVMIDAQGALQADVPGIAVDATVSRQWGQGEPLLHQAVARGVTGVGIVFLGTNGPITDADFDAMMAAAQGLRRVVFVTVHVDRPWQDQDNSVIAAGVARYPNAVLADWFTFSQPHPEWFYPADGTHMPIGGPGAQALAALVASKVG